MGLVKITFDGSSVSAKQDADLNHHVNGLVPAGVLKGLGNELSVSVANNYITFQSGYVQIYGRRIYVEANSSVYVSLDSTKYGYIIIVVDLSNNSVTLTKTESASTYPTLTQQDLSNGGSIYQMPIAQYNKTTTALTLTSFRPTLIDTPLNAAESCYNRFLNYARDYLKPYQKKGGSSYQTTIYLTADQRDSVNDTLFFAKLSTGHVIVFAGWAINSISAYISTYCDGGTNYTVDCALNSAKDTITLTCSNRNHKIAYVYAVR